MKTIAIVLDPLGHNSQVMIDGMTIPGVRGVEVRAFVGDLAAITLHLIGHVELTADLDRVELVHFKGGEATRPGDRDQGEEGGLEPRG